MRAAAQRAAPFPKSTGIELRARLTRQAGRRGWGAEEIGAQLVSRLEHRAVDGGVAEGQQAVCW